MSKQTEVSYFMRQSSLRGDFYRDNFRRFVWINLLLCCIILGQLAYIFLQYSEWMVSHPDYYVSTSSGQLTLINGRLR